MSDMRKLKKKKNPLLTSLQQIQKWLYVFTQDRYNIYNNTTFPPIWISQFTPTPESNSTAP